MNAHSSVHHARCDLWLRVVHGIEGGGRRGVWSMVGRVVGGDWSVMASVGVAGGVGC